MIHLLYIYLLGLMPLIDQPPVKLIAYKQAVSKAKATMEMTMNGKVKKRELKPTNNYLIWLAIKDLANTTIVSVKVNNTPIAFDTAHVWGAVIIEDDLRMPNQKNRGTVIQDGTGSSIRIYLKASPVVDDTATESITIRYKQKNKCSKKIKKSIEWLPARIRQ